MGCLLAAETRVVMRSLRPQEYDMFVITGATSSHAPNFNLSTPAFAQDFEQAEPAFRTVHARGLSEAPAMPEKPYVRGQHKTQAELMRERWNTANPFNPMP